MYKIIAIAASLFLMVSAAPQTQAPVPAPSSDATAEIKNYSDQINPDGSFSYQFDTTNGINIQQSGTSNGTIQGTVQYQSPEGEQIQLSYIADENGYQPTGSYVPTSPPIPDGISKALEYIHEPATDAPQKA